MYKISYLYISYPDPSMTENVFWFSSRIDCLTSCISLIVGTKTFSVKNSLTCAKLFNFFKKLEKFSKTVSRLSEVGFK